MRVSCLVPSVIIVSTVELTFLVFKYLNRLKVRLGYPSDGCDWIHNSSDSRVFSALEPTPDGAQCSTRVP
jgi:hypothetical protein